MSKTYDVLVIGSGTAGQTAAYELKTQGLTVGVVEHSDRPGGTCALSGCQAKKWFYEGAEIVARSHHLAAMGVTSPATASWQDLRREKNKFTSKVPANTIRGLEKSGIDFIGGRARFVGRRSIAVGGVTIGARCIILATGARPAALDIDGARWLVGSRQFMELGQLPPRIVFIGGGFISFEFAHFAARLGPQGVHCTILEAGPRPLMPFDEEMVELLAEASRLEGIEIHNDVAVTAIEKNGETFTVQAKDGGSFEADLVVHGAGRSADIDDLDLDRASIESTRRGVSVGETMATSNPRVYAVGDCAATIQLARVADAEARVAAANIARTISGKGNKVSMNYNAVPSVLFTFPQYGMVGSTEQMLDDDGVDYQKSFGKGLGWPTYKRVGMRSAAFKLLATGKGQLLGAHILSDNACGLIGILTLAMVNEIPVGELYRQCIMTPYPSRESDVIYMLKPFIS